MKIGIKVEGSGGKKLMTSSSCLEELIVFVSSRVVVILECWVWIGDYK